jgi:hypothetical protein
LGVQALLKFIQGLPLKGRLRTISVAALTSLMFPLVAFAQTNTLVVEPDRPLAMTIDGKPLQIFLETGSIDRLVIHRDVANRLRLKPTLARGRANVRIGPTRVLEGRNRPVALKVGGVGYTARAFWFEGVPGKDGDGNIGPWGLPQDRIEVRLNGAGTTLFRFPLLGAVNSQSYTRFEQDGGAVGLNFAVEDQSRLPIASAAAGADIARAYGGVATEDVWEEEILLGVRRPVRLVKLARPLKVGPFRFNEIAVRIRDRLDGTGSGGAIPTAPQPNDDSAEIVIVTGQASKGPTPVRTLSIGRRSLQECRQLSFIKSQSQIELLC